MVEQLKKYGNLHDCPVCNNSMGSPQPAQHPEGRWFVQCTSFNCGASSGFYDTEADAIAGWNNQPLRQQVEQLLASNARMAEALKLIEPSGNFDGWENSGGEKIGHILNAALSTYNPAWLEADRAEVRSYSDLEIKLAAANKLIADSREQKPAGYVPIWTLEEPFACGLFVQNKSGEYCEPVYRAPVIPPVSCEWRYGDDCWETGCGNLHILLEGSPKENGMDYCCYCGAKISEHAAENNAETK